MIFGSGDDVDVWSLSSDLNKEIERLKSEVERLTHLVEVEIPDMLDGVWGAEVAEDVRNIGKTVVRTKTGWTTGKKKNL